MVKKDGDASRNRGTGIPGGNKLPTLYTTPKVTRCRLRSSSSSRGTRHACAIKVGRKRGGRTLSIRKSLSYGEGPTQVLHEGNLQKKNNWLNKSTMKMSYYKTRSIIFTCRRYINLYFLGNQEIFWFFYYIYYPSILSALYQESYN